MHSDTQKQILGVTTPWFFYMSVSLHVFVSVILLIEKNLVKRETSVVIMTMTDRQNQLRTLYGCRQNCCSDKLLWTQI